MCKYIYIHTLLSQSWSHCGLITTPSLWKVAIGAWGSNSSRQRDYKVEGAQAWHQYACVLVLAWLLLLDLSQDP